MMWPVRDVGGSMTSDLVVLDLEGNVTDHGSNLRPSSDTKTHLHLYRAFQRIGGIRNSHSHR